MYRDKICLQAGTFYQSQRESKTFFSGPWTRHPFFFEYIADYQMCFFCTGLIVTRKPSTSPDRYKNLTFATWLFIAPATVWALNRSRALHYVISRTGECNWFAMTEVVTSPVPLMRTARIWARLWEKWSFKLKQIVTAGKLLWTNTELSNDLMFNGVLVPYLISSNLGSQYPSFFFHCTALNIETFLINWRENRKYINKTKRNWHTNKQIN